MKKIAEGTCVKCESDLNGLRVWRERLVLGDFFLDRTLLETCMANRRSGPRGFKKKARSKLQPAITDIVLQTKNGTSGSYLNYVDTARELSKINRRLYSQSRMYAYQGLTFIWRQDAANPLSTVEVTVRTAGNSWVVQNAHVKGHALWNQMQELVLEDNPSIKGKWHDYKLRLCGDQITAREMLALDGRGVAYATGEWNLASYVMPQHDVDPVTGLPLPAVEFTAVLVGAETVTTRSLVKAYEESRATVQPVDPNVPAGMSTSFFNLLTDSGSQEPELADVIEDENDEPPYDTVNYPGGGINAPEPVTVGYGAISAQEVDGRIGGFVAPIGILEIEVVGFGPTGVKIAAGDMPDIDLVLHVAPGMYKGVASVPMGQ